MEDVLSSNKETVNNVITFLINKAKRLYYEKNTLYLKIMKLIKNMDDFLLQSEWGEDWEVHKPDRKSDDPTNDHPGNPKPTH